MSERRRARPGPPSGMRAAAILVLGLVMSQGPVIAQIHVAEGVFITPAFSGYSAFHPPCPGPFCSWGPSSGDITDSGDVFVVRDVEVGAALYLSKALYLEGQATTGAEGDQFIFFYDNGQRQGEFLSWDDSADKFQLSDGLEVLGALDVNRSVNGKDESALFLSSLGSVVVLLDSDGESTSKWQVQHEAPSEILAEIQEDGSLKIRGTLTQNATDFDLAEGFLMVEPVQPGDVVNIVSGSPHSVELATTDDGATVLGVVSSEPGVFLGGGFFDEAGVAEWGPELLAKYHAERTKLVAAVLRDHPELSTRVTALGLGVTGLLDEEPAALSEEARLTRSDLSRQILDRFATRNIAPVALAGRVTVTVDASFGAIEVGDLLATSSIPGIARKADGRGMVLGTALEALAEGPGQVLMMVGRGYPSGMIEARSSRASEEGTNAAVLAVAAEQRTELVAAYTRIDELEKRLAYLERFLQTAYVPSSGDTVVATLSSP